MRLYVAGPMTGYDDLNYPAFNRTAIALAANGHEVYNPASTFNGAYLDLPYDIWLREAIRLVSMVNGIVLLDRWWVSKGALTEIHIGLSLGMPFYMEQNGQLVQLDMTYKRLIEAMDDYYLGEAHVTANGVSESGGGYPRQAESGKDYRFGSDSIPAPGLEAALVR